MSNTHRRRCCPKSAPRTPLDYLARMRRTSASTPRPCHPQPPAPLAHRPRAPPPLPYLTSTTTAITRSWGRVLSYTFEHLTGTTTMRSSGWGTTRAMRSCAKPIESWLSSKQVGLEFSSPPHPSWLASRCLRHRVHVLSTQLHLLPRSQPPPRPSLLYIALAARYHPDKQKDEESAKVAAEKFRIVGHAHKVQ